MTHERRYTDPARPAHADDLEVGLHRAQVALDVIARAVVDGDNETALSTAVGADIDIDAMLWRIHGDAVDARRAALTVMSDAIDVDYDAKISEAAAGRFADALELLDDDERDMILAVLRASL